MSNETYTVDFLHNNASVIKFMLSEKEKSEIIQLYYSLNIDKVPGKMEVDASGNTTPLIPTILYVNKVGSTQEIKIWRSFDDNGTRSVGAGEVSKFINLIENIVRSKPEVKNAPQSTVLYR